MISNSFVIWTLVRLQNRKNGPKDLIPGASPGGACNPKSKHYAPGSDGALGTNANLGPFESKSPQQLLFDRFRRLPVRGIDDVGVDVQRRRDARVDHQGTSRHALYSTLPRELLARDFDLGSSGSMQRSRMSSRSARLRKRSRSASLRSETNTGSAQSSRRAHSATVAAIAVVFPPPGRPVIDHFSLC